MKLIEVEANIKNQGFKITAVRHELLKIFEICRRPLSVGDILTSLKIKKLTPNKTTIYRELAFLKKQDVILEIQLGEDKKRYESAHANHHHHLVCVKCDKVQDVVLATELTIEEKLISKNNQFKVTNHALEFFGLCHTCQ